MPVLRMSLDPYQNRDPDFDFVATLELARKGDGAAIEQLARIYYQPVQEMVHRELSRDLRQSYPWLASRFSTGDVVHDVFRSLLQDLDSFEGETEEAFVGYLATVVRNRLLDALRFHQAARRDGRKTSQMPDELDIRAGMVGPGTHLAGMEEVERFQLALAEFSEQERLLLRERLEHQTPFTELATRLGYSSKWAASRAFYAAQAKLVIRMGIAGEEKA